MPLGIPGGLPAATIDAGFNITVANKVTASQTAANAGASTGSPSANADATNPFFCVIPRGDGGSRTASFHGRGVGGSLTTLTGQLFASADGGASFNPWGAALNLVAAGTAADQVVVNLPAGPIFQLLFTTVALNTATSAACDVSVS